MAFSPDTPPPCTPAAPQPGAAADAASTRKTTSELFPIVYEKMRAVAEKRLQQLPPGQTLQATALVNEVFLKLADGGDAGWDHTGHLYGAAAQAMREILIDQARRKSAGVNGGGLCRIELNDSMLVSPGNDWAGHLIDLDRALCKLERENQDRAQIVMLKFFAGLTFEQIAQCLNVCADTVERRWKFIQAWLHREMTHPSIAMPA